MSFPGRKCAVVDDVNPSGLGSTGMSKLSELLAQPTEDGVLILTVRGSARRFAKKEAAATKLLNLCDKAGGVCRFAAMTRGDVGTSRGRPRCGWAVCWNRRKPPC